MTKRFFTLALIGNIIMSILVGSNLEKILESVIFLELIIFFLFWLEDRLFEKP
jgi:hypothetical protein